jgi:hypothetical protein
MLFDLRGRGRRRTVQVIYLSLAILMGGGLVLFGIGGATNGGLVDAINGSGSSEVDTDVYKDKVVKLQQQLKTDPKNQQALADLTRAQVQQASVIGFSNETGTYSRKGIEGLQEAAKTWERYLDTSPKKPDGGLGLLMVSAFGGSGLNDPQKAATAMELVIDARGPSPALYTQLALLHYQAGDVRRSVLAERQAMARTKPERRKLLKAQIAAQRKQVDTARLSQATGSEEGDIEIDPSGGTSTSKSGTGTTTGTTTEKSK